MTLLIIVICLLSERFLLHVSTGTRFSWFANYVEEVQKRLSTIPLFSRDWLMLLAVILPIIILVALILAITTNILWGLVSLLLQIVIFHYCIGPDNPFYPVRSSSVDEKSALGYLCQVNTQLFAVITWYVVLGPIGALVYRLANLCQKNTRLSLVATKLFNVLDWLPSRITALMYLLAGNFQPGFRFFSKHFFNKPEDNHLLLTACITEAVSKPVDLDEITPLDEQLIERSLIILLVLMALCTLASWL